MKRRSLITVLFTIIFSIASWAGVNRTLEEAQSLFTKAKTAAQYEAAKKKYRSAAYDPGYNSVDDDMSINEGIRKCDIAIERLTPRLMLNDQNYLNLTLKAEGGREYVNVKTNASSWDASGVPSWCSITEKSRSSFCISYEANPNSYTRTGSMTIYTNNGKEVRIDMSQRAGSQQSELTITGAKFSNQDYDGNILSDYGSTLYSDDMRYLSCRVDYNGLSSSITKYVYIKIYNPDGSLKTGDSSPEGYSYRQEITFNSGNNSAWVGSWGNNSQSSYVEGTYRYEIWIDGKKVYTAYPYISSGGGGYYSSASQLKITGAEFCNTDQDGNIIDSYGSTLYASDMRYLSCRINYDGLSSSATKTVYMKMFDPDGNLNRGSSSPEGYTRKREVTFSSGSGSVSLGGWGNSTKSTYTPGTYRYEFWIDGNLEYTAYVTIKSAQTAEIDDVWVDHNVYEDGYKGMRVHVKFDISGAKDHSCQVALYFYDENENALTDYDDTYDTVGGKVATHVTVTPKYDNTTYNDIAIFMPYNQLHLNTYGAKKKFKYRVQIHDNTVNSMLDTTDYYEFLFSN